MTSYSDASIVAGPSRLSSVVGVWTKKADIAPTVSSDAVEVDARRETPPNFSLPIRPRAVYTTYHEHRGVLYSLESCRLSCESFSVPPPYSPRGYISTVTEKHTEVSSEEEPPTLARMLFKYGFFFFPFWLAVIYILRSPLIPTPDWEAGKSDKEKSHQMQLLRRTELKRAHRCLWVMSGLIVTVFFLVLIIKFGVLNDVYFLVEALYKTIL